MATCWSWATWVGIRTTARTLSKSGKRACSTFEKLWGSRVCHSHELHGTPQVEAHTSHATATGLGGVLLDPLHEEVHFSGVLAEVDDAGARALDALLGGAISLHLGEADPLAELLGTGHLHEGDVVLVAHGLDELLVRGLIAVSGQAAQAGGAAVQRAGSPAKKNNLQYVTIDRTQTKPCVLDHNIAISADPTCGLCGVSSPTPHTMKHASFTWRSLQ